MSGSPVLVRLPGLPPTPAEARRERLHGVDVDDPYRWLEGSAAPEVGGEDPALDRRVAAWTAAQNAYTRAVLDALPGRAGLEARLRELMEAGAVTAPAARGDRQFFWRRAGDQAQWEACVRDGRGGAARVLVDPNRLDPEGQTSLAWTEPSRDGSLLAFGLFRDGDEATVLHLLDVPTGGWRADQIPGKAEGVSWLADASGFFYRRLADVADPYSGQIRFHLVGGDHRDDPVLFAQHREGPLATTWGPFAAADRDGRWMVLGYWTGTDANDLWAVDLDRWRRTGDFAPVPLCVGEGARSFGEVVGDTLYLQTTAGAPHGRVVAVDLADPARSRWREIVPERPDAVLESIAVAGGLVAATYLVSAVSSIEVFSLGGEPLRRLALPGIGSAALAAEPDTTAAFLTYASFHHPPTIWRVDLATGEGELWWRTEIPVDPSAVEVRQVRFRSKDGTEVPMFVVHRRGLVPSGDHPALLSGYGGFGISQTPAFAPGLVPWLEAGGVYAVANLRGGGELGQAWHRAGMLAAKQNVFDDFVAAAEWLIAHGYTRRERLAATGGSNGGLLTGAAMTQRPDLVAAVVCRVPLLDMLRYHHFLMARYWVPEYGSAEDPAQFAALLAYSPYHRVVPGVRYPAVLLTAGENDARVHPLHARKMAARLQAAADGDPDAAPILLSIESRTGHGAGKPLEHQIRETADQVIFLMWRLGMLDEDGR
jgi:prolyl oligopeptidase